MTTSNDLAPWVHPKASSWFKQALKRSGLMTGIEDFMSKPAENISLAECRMVLMFVIILGRRGIWPEGYDDILALVESKITKIIGNSQGTVRKKLTLSEHQRHAAMMTEIQQELEILRRRVGASRLKSRVGQPKTWKSFWN